MINDWKRFPAQHDIVYEKAGDRWQDGLFIGNGALGDMCRAISASTIKGTPWTRDDRLLAG